jgi:hypothetical protein
VIEVINATLIALRAVWALAAGLLCFLLVWDGRKRG